MPLLHEATDAKKLDVRMLERNVNRGVMSHDEAQKSLSQLPDDADNAEWISIDSLAQDQTGTQEGNGSSSG